MIDPLWVLFFGNKRIGTHSDRTARLIRHSHFSVKHVGEMIYVETIDIHCRIDSQVPFVSLVTVDDDSLS